MKKSNKILVAAFAALVLIIFVMMIVIKMEFNKNYGDKFTVKKEWEKTE